MSMAAFVLRFSGSVDSTGRLVLDNRAAFDGACLPLAGQHVEVTIRRWQRRRTLAQNAAWWGLAMQTLSEWNGEEPEEWHRRLKRQFGIKSTARLSVTEFEDLRERTIRYAAQEHGVVIPDPDSVSL